MTSISSSYVEAHGDRRQGKRQHGGRPAQRPALLFLCQTLPFPPDGGVNIRTYNVLRILAKTFDVTALCFYRQSDRRSPGEVEASLAGLRGIAEVEAFAIPQERSRLRLLYDHVRSLFTGRAYTRYVYESRPFTSRLRDLLRSRKFTLVHVDSLDLCAYLPLVDSLPVVCVHHNVESQLLRRRAKTEASWFRRAYIALQARLLEGEERRWCPAVALNVVVSEADRETLSRLAPNAAYAVIPNGVDTEYFHPGGADANRIVFVGGSNWFPNRDGRDFFSTEILPRIRELGCDAPVQWVGHASDADRAEFRDRHGIEMTGYVADVRPYLRDAACVVVPLRVGGGTRLKILDAWAMGKAVVSTSPGCEGLRAVDGENILIRDTTEGFAQAVCGVCRDTGLRRRLGENGRSTAETVYSWGKLGGDIAAAYSALTKQHTT